MGKFSKKLFNLYQRHPFITKSIGMIGVGGISLYGKRFYTKDHNHKLIETEIEKCITGKTESYADLIRAFQNDPAYAHQIVIARFEEIVKNDQNWFIFNLLKSNSENFYSLVKKACENGNIMTSSEMGCSTLFSLLKQELENEKDSQKINNLFTKLAVKEFINLASSWSGSDFLTVIITDYNLPFIDLIKENIDFLLKQSRGHYVILAALNNSDMKQWLSSYAIENIDKLYGNTPDMFLEEVISKCSEEDLFKFKEAICKLADKRDSRAKEKKKECGYDWYKVIDIGNRSTPSALVKRITEIERERVIQQLIYENKRVIQTYEEIQLGKRKL